MHYFSNLVFLHSELCNFAPMINIETLRDYCLSLGEVVEKMPFSKFKGGDTVLVFYVCGHMFCYFDIETYEVVSVKCQPERIDELKAEHDWIGNPFNESPKHWIGIRIKECDGDALVRELVKNSFEIVKNKYSKTDKPCCKKEPKPRTLRAKTRTATS